MIWALDFFKAVPWRAVGMAALVAAVAVMGWRVSAWRSAYTALPGAQEALQREVECGEGSTCRQREKAAQAQAEAASAVVVGRYERELEDLRNRPVPSVPVRLCRPASRGPLRDGAAATATGASGGADVPIEAGRDIAVELYRLADEADAEALKLKALWQWNQALSAD